MQRADGDKFETPFSGGAGRARAGLEEQAGAGWAQMLASRLASGAFLSGAYDRKPHRFAPLPPGAGHGVELAQVLEFLVSGAPWRLKRAPELYLDGLRVPAEDLAASFVDMDGLPALAPRLERIRRLAASGATAALYGAAPFFPELAEAARAIGLLFHAEVEGHIFVSSQGVQGLAPHYDCTDVFVVQLAGRKAWHVSTQRADNPVAGMAAPEEFDPQRPVDVFELDEGDILYLPRGTFHWAVAASEVSLHASFVSRTPTRLEVLCLLLEEAANDPALRAYFPSMDASRSAVSDRVAVAETLAGLADLAGRPGVIDRILAQVAERMPGRPGH